MQPASPFQAVTDHTEAAPPGKRAAAQPSVWDFAEVCLQRTAEALHECHAATTAEIHQAIATVRESHAEEKPADMIEVIARIQGHEEEHIAAAILELGNKVALGSNPFQPVIPFAGKLIAPSAFYESFDTLHKLARALLSPVVFAEDTDSIGTASINPIATGILAAEIESSVHRRFGIRPFVTTSRLDYESWCFLSRKHFEL